MSIRLADISKRFGAFTALTDINLTARPGEFLALLGPSGSGKTTLLRIIAGLEFPERGTVHFEGTDITGLSVAERRIGFVFQQYALFKHMTVAENVGFGLSVRPRRERPSRHAIRARAQELLDLVQLGDLGRRLPAQLSGGQRQRVALARALAVDPTLLLLDEPFGALDAKVRKELRHWLRGFHDRVGLTSIFVTHDQEEALEVADRVVVMSNGAIEQVGTPAEVYDTPANAFVFDFVGESNRIPVTAVDGKVIFHGVALDVDTARARGPAELFFRPHDARIGSAHEAGIDAIVALVRPREGRVRVESAIAGVAGPIELDVAPEAAPTPGQAIRIVPTRARVFPLSLAEERAA
ncbi:sulfate/molybdate ABC transporter ATP-binding protein [Hephaestia sp. GCM10023244]|uniref:sulfate/molybdate ABC transporter ATP-binding protein n=1 Tax=unclassified Hephaestia TaxID=2631281 RepID=UPI002076F96D|nr:sulfate/molybdate ABC transporter ATP-binding protein [Hephaestia sp. MAHUQ-44]MCM8731941.1 sulfate/molybdate ABC transporter ATP-binding protein [Hephaestia sp. MAHUQ-44]